MKFITVFIILLSHLTVFVQNKIEPKLFAEGLISTTENDELFITFTPDMKRLYFSKRAAGGVFTIHFSENKNGVWSNPQVASFSGKFKDQAPFISPDGKKLIRFNC